MARIRSVSPDLRQSETVAHWPIAARYAWVLLWGYLDDYGRGLDNARVIAADCFPLDDDITGTVLAEWLERWADDGSICRYEHESKRYLHALNWSDYQKPQHPSKMRIPPCKEHEAGALAAWESARQTEHRRLSGDPHETFVTVSPTRGRGGGVEEEMRGRSSAPPRCERHRRSKNPPACGQCKELRIRWENETPTPALALVPPALSCPDHPGELAGACRGCAADQKAADK